MVRRLIFSFALFPAFCFGQSMTGPELLNKTIEYHDPQGQWKNLEATFELSQSRPDGSERLTDFKLRNGESYFELNESRDDNAIRKVVTNDGCDVTFNGATTFSSDEADEYRLNCDQVTRMRDYYTYLYGLPMKLRDPGTNVSEAVGTDSFNGKEYYRLEVTYDSEVGNDTWWFYIDKNTYAMEGYRFTHENGKGEYITLEGEAKFGKMRIPKLRKWYIIKDDRYLGADDIVKIRK